MHKSLRTLSPAIGCCLTWTCVFGVAFAVVLFMMTVFILRGVPAERLFDELDALDDSVALGMTLEFGGILFSCLGGYVAAYISGTHHKRQALITGLFILTLMVLLELGDGGERVTWYEMISFVSVAPAALLGGILASKWQSGRPTNA